MVEVYCKYCFNSLKFLLWNVLNCDVIIFRLGYFIFVLFFCLVVLKYWRYNFGKVKKILFNKLYYDYDKVSKVVSVCISLV